MLKQITIPGQANKVKLSDWLISNGIAVAAACGGRGVCGKCAVKVVSGSFYSLSEPEKLYGADKDGYILSCRALCGEKDAVIEIEDSNGEGLSEFLLDGKSQTDGKKGFGIALDIGTTTLAGALVDLSNGKTVQTYSCLNPQRVYGADVISRISACTGGKLAELNRAIINATNAMINIFKNFSPKSLYVAGNTTMLHIFCNISPEKMGAYPFTPEFTECRRYKGEELGIGIDSVTVLPSASAFIGADIMCGAAYCKMTELDGPSVLLDLGTNGETLLCTGKKRENRFIAASTAAGPALEGANISCGVGGIPGAVCAVCRTDRTNGVLTYKTVSDSAVTGLCGCGLVDLVSEMLNSGIIDETGALENGDFTLCGAHTDKNGNIIRFDEPEKRIILTQKDIREFQLAKSAVRAGLTALVSQAGLELSDLERVYLAGGLGYYMNINNAANVGMIPPELTDKTVSVGNTALGGAVSSLISDGFFEEIKSISQVCTTFELNSSSVFNEAFIEYMLFGEEE